MANLFPIFIHSPILLLFLLLLFPDAECARILFGRKDHKIKVHEPSAESNPKLDHIPFDPMIEAFEERRDDRAWEREHFRRHYEEMRRRKAEYLKRHQDHYLHRYHAEHDHDVDYHRYRAEKHYEHHYHHQKHEDYGAVHHGDEHHGDEHHGDEHHGDEHHGGEHHGGEHHGDEHHGDEHHGVEHHENEHHENEHHEGGNEGSNDDENFEDDDYLEAVPDEDVDGSQENPSYEDPDDYFDEEKFNITRRLTELFPLIDTNPNDGYVSLQELTQWHLNIARKASLHRTDREIMTYDRNGDGLITLKEYLKDDTPGDAIKTDWEDHEKDWARTSTAQFPLADTDGDGKLNRTEFNDLLHPEDSENEKLLKWHREEEIRTRDLDKDGKLGFEDFYKSVYPELSDSPEDLHSDDDHHHATHGNDKDTRAKAKFSELDKNHNSFLEEDELIPIMQKLAPGESFYSHEQANSLLEQADDNHDGKLDIDEMLNNPYVFYTTVYETHHSDVNDNDEYSHDEF